MAHKLREAIEGRLPKAPSAAGIAYLELWPI